MKKIVFLLLTLGGMLLLALSVNAQTFIYKLNQNLLGNVPEAPELIQIPNNSGFTGEFVSRTVPSTTCEEGGTAGGYFFEDDAGLQFNCPPDFISESYSLSLIFQIDEFIAPPPWVRILSFTHTDDHGVYIKLTNPPINGTLEFWPNGMVGEDDFFDTENFYQLILVRNDAGLIKIYVNGAEFSEYDDSGTQEYKFHDPENYLIFFRDDPSVLADEASPGFVSNIKITNVAWDSDDVTQEWEDFCSSLLDLPELDKTRFSIYPNPVSTRLNVNFDDELTAAKLSVIDLSGRVHVDMDVSSRKLSIDISALPQGMYFLKTDYNGQSSVMKFSKR